MKKRLLSALLCLCMVVCMMPTVSLAANPTSGTCGENVTWSLSDDGTLTISGTGEMADYTYDSPAPWNGNSDDIKTAVIENGVTSIGDYAFAYCSSLTSVTIPDSVTSIGDFAFDECTSLTSVTIPNSVTSIGDYAFSYTGYSDEDSNWKDDILYCDNWVLASKNITTANIEKNTKGIANTAFEQASNLSSVTIPDTVTSIGDRAFYACGSLTSVTIPNSVTSIGNEAFYYCKKLTSVTISDSVTSIGENTFFQCNSLSSVTIPNKVTSIGDSAFYACGSLTSVEIPDSVTSIGPEAFHSCCRLTNLTIPESIVQIGDHAFGMLYDSNGTHKLLESFVANVKKGSTAETYCKDNSIAFENEHTWVTDAAVAPTCETAGKTKGVHCSGCGKVREVQEMISATGHKAVTDAAVAPTCGTAGKTEGSHCSVCNEVFVAQEEIAATGKHTWNNGEVTKEATCTATGIKTYTCTVCEATKNDEIPATGHSFTNYVYNNDAKPGADGTETAKCDNGCNTTDTRTKAGTAKPTVTFTDIDESEYYAKPVQWAVEHEITNGVGDGAFAPNTVCTRGQIMTFLWRANGEPEPTSTNNPFTDVPENEYYYKAVLWAVEQGITTGTSATTFSPNQGCTRGQVATFLWRAEGKPSSSVSNQFSDVDTSEYYGTAVLWASEKGITNGMGDGTFAPNATCTRGQIVTFLYRAMA